jgi:hypothetical protein
MLNVIAPAVITSESARRDSNDGATAGPAPSPAAERTSAGPSFYRYRDDGGRLVIVDSLARVPTSARGSVETVVLAPSPGTSLGEWPGRLTQDFHGPSFLAGVGLALALGALWLLLARRQSRVMRFALLGGLMLAGSSAYLGWVRRTTGHGESLVASPAALIEDARSAVRKMNERTREQQRTLEQLGAER